jgi:hypothetical protein
VDEVPDLLGSRSWRHLPVAHGNRRVVAQKPGSVTESGVPRVPFFMTLESAKNWGDLLSSILGDGWLWAAIVVLVAHLKNLRLFRCKELLNC